MRNTLALWLTAIIVLTVLAILYVFKPIVFGTPRRDPIDANKWLRPVGVEAKDFKPEKEPSQPFFTIPGSNTPVYLYEPRFDLKLGLDLRGGMRVTLQIPNRAEFNYPPKPGVIADPDAASAMQVSLNTELAKMTDLGDPKKINVEVTEQMVRITTQPDTDSEARIQLGIINGVMKKVFGDDKFINLPIANTVFKQAGTAEQTAVTKIMDNRLNKTGLTEVTSQTKGLDQIVLEIPGVKDPELVQRMIGTTAHMEFRLIPAGYNVSIDPETKVASGTHGQQSLTNDEIVQASYFVLPGSALRPNSDIVPDRTASATNPSAMAVSFAFDQKNDRDHFLDVTSKNIGRLLAITLDGQIFEVATIKDKLPGEGVIEGGGMDTTAAKELSVMLNAGALPVPVTVLETRLISPSLGADSVSRSLMAGLVGLVLVLLFMGIYYRLPGIMANLALIIYICLSLAVLKFFEATLTLPGFAGIIISIGMAVDANVIIFERLKEELRTQKPLETAVEVAFSRAWTAILDSNVASLITGSVLWALGTGAVRGFAITLVIGVAVSLFTAVTVTRLLMRLMVRSHAGHNLSWYGL